MSTNPLRTLRKFVRPRGPSSKLCELCAAALPDEHDHLVEPESRRLMCCCLACGLLFTGDGSTKYRRVPRDVHRLADFRLTDAQWESLSIPIDLAFFFHDSASDKIVAFYPSPAGAMESLLSLEAWQSLLEDNPILGEFESDVEALLVDRVGQHRDYFRTPIDECYKLVGLIRTHWRGLSGGPEVWDEIATYFKSLREKAREVSG